MSVSEFRVFALSSEGLMFHVTEKGRGLNPSAACSFTLVNFTALDCKNKNMQVDYQIFLGSLLKYHQCVVHSVQQSEIKTTETSAAEL